MKIRHPTLFTKTGGVHFLVPVPVRYSPLRYQLIQRRPPLPSHEARLGRPVFRLPNRQ